MVTDGSDTCGEHSIAYRDGDSPWCTPETNVRVCVNYTLKKIFKEHIAIFKQCECQKIKIK